MIAICSIVLPVSFKGATSRLTAISKVVRRNILGAPRPYSSTGLGAAFLQADDLGSGLRTAIRKQYGICPRGICSASLQTFAERSPEDPTLNAGDSSTCGDAVDDLVIDRDDVEAERHADTDDDTSPVYGNLRISMASPQSSQVREMTWMLTLHIELTDTQIACIFVVAFNWLAH